MPAGDQICGSAAREPAGKHAHSMVLGAVGRIRTHEASRVQWWRWEQLGVAGGERRIDGSGGRNRARTGSELQSTGRGAGGCVVLGYELHELWPQRRAQPWRRAMAMVATMATGTETVGNGGEMTACSPWRYMKARRVNGSNKGGESTVMAATPEEEEDGVDVGAPSSNGWHRTT